MFESNFWDAPPGHFIDFPSPGFRVFIQRTTKIEQFLYIERFFFCHSGFSRIHTKSHILHECKAPQH